MNNPIPNPNPQPPQPQSWYGYRPPWYGYRPSWYGYCRCSGSNLLFGLGVALLVCGAAITGRHEATMIGLGLIIFSSLCDW